MFKRFDEIYTALNAKQREAVNSIEGPVMVIAGPGTGKTTVLTLRIANILRKTDASPDAILALTFTESGVRSMRKKLVEIIGPRAYRVHLNTFHSLANELIKTYPDKFPRIIGAEHIEGLEQISLVEKLLENGKYKLLYPKGEPHYYIKKIIDAIKDLKKDDISADDLRKLILREEKEIHSVPDFHHYGGKFDGEIKRTYREKLEQVGKNKELARAYRAYEKALEKARLYDYEDMITKDVQRLEADEDFRLRLGEEYQYILADEHQDANKTQNRLLELLSSFHENPNLFIVGDEKQAIFRFQGASLENFLYFREKFLDTRLIALSENYRSHQTILDAAHSLIENNPLPSKEFRARLRASPGRIPEKVAIVKAPDRVSEITYVVSEIRSLLDAGTQAREIVILVRDNKHAEPIERELKRRGILVSRFADADVLDHPYVDGLLNLIRAAVNPSDDELVAKAAFVACLDYDPFAVSRVLSKRERGKTLVDAFSKNPETKPFVLLLSRLARLVRSEPLAEGFECVARESGFERFIVAHARSRELLPFYAGLFDAVTRYAERDKKATLADFLERLDKAKEHGHSISAAHIPPDGVSLMTAHGGKGLEFDAVFILHANDGIWGGRKNRRSFSLPLDAMSEDADFDERRLFYVALTRARKRVTVSYYERGEDGKEKSPSRFVYEIDEAHRVEKNAPPFDVSERIANSQAVINRTLKEKPYLNALFLERGFSVTHLNNFLSCPWRYFFVDLLRMPKRKDNAALYGSAVHSALKHYFDAYAREEDITAKKAAELFENYLWRTHMSARDFRDYAKEGKREIAAYLSRYEFPRAIFNEFRITGVPFLVNDTEIVLTGQLDKVEIISDGAVNVVDYKTGKPRTRNEIEGKTKNADGNYGRQLIFYKLLLDRYKKGEWKMETGTIDFIKTDARGKFHREAFFISPEDVKNLEKKVADSARQILDLSFWDKTCGRKNCEWCNLRKVWRE